MPPLCSYSIFLSKTFSVEYQSIKVYLLIRHFTSAHADQWFTRMTTKKTMIQPDKNSLKNIQETQKTEMSYLLLKVCFGLNLLKMFSYLEIQQQHTALCLPLARSLLEAEQWEEDEHSKCIFIYDLWMKTALMSKNWSGILIYLWLMSCFSYLNPFPVWTFFPFESR